MLCSGLNSAQSREATTESPSAQRSRAIPAYGAGMEITILDDRHPAYAEVRPTQRHGSTYDVIPARTGFLNKTGE